MKIWHEARVEDPVAMMPTMGSLPAGDVALIAEAKKTRKSRLDRRDYFALVDPSTFEQVTDTRSLRRP